MKKISIFTLLTAIGLTACSSHTPVEVAKATDSSVIVPQAAVKPAEIPANTPSNATAICRDGSYSTATENICAGNGGALTIISRYHAE